MKIRKSNYSLYLCLNYFLLVFTFFSFYTSKAQKNIQIDSLNEPYTIDDYYYSGNQTINIDNLSTIDIREFTKASINNSKSGTLYWSTFNIKPTVNLHLNYLQFDFPLADRVTIYIPMYKGAYQEYTLGLSNPRKRVKSIWETSTIIIESKDINFEKPFFIQNSIMSVFGTNSLRKKPIIIGYNEKPLTLKGTYRRYQLERESSEFEFIFFFGIIAISFVFMMVYYIIHKRKYLLFYALYLFFLIMIYISWMSHFYNFFSRLHHYSYIYLNINAIFLANLCYMFFLKYFLEIKKNYKKLNPAFNRLIISVLLFTILCDLTIIINPNTAFFNKLSLPGIYVTSVINFILICYMFIRRRLIHTTIVFIGSVVLFLGFIFSVILSNPFIIGRIIIIETVLFMSVISYLDFKNFKKALESEKLREIDELKSNISHELRTPLTLISVSIEQRLENPNISVEDHNDFDMMQRNSKRMLDLIDQILEVSKSGSASKKIQVQKGDALGLLTGLAASFEHQANQKQLNYSINIQNADNVWYNDDVLGKIATNLLSNAIKYTPKGGSITCEASIKDENLCFCVKNTGDGLSKAQLKKVFERFYQVDKKQSGSGIGLAYVKELVEQYKGEIIAKSQPNSWTLFRVNLPVDQNTFIDIRDTKTDTKTSTILQESRTYKEDLLNEIKVDSNREDRLPILLIVEGNEDIRSVLKKLFKNNYKIKTAKNGQEGIDLAIKHIPDLIISDIMMPIKDGIALTKELKNDERTSHIPIILLTAKVGEENELKGVKIGADDYIIKPFSTPMLIAKVEKIIENRQKVRDRYSQGSVFRPAEIATTTRDEQFLLKVEKILYEKLDDPSFSAEEFSKLLGMSRMQLHRKLVALLELSTTEFIRKERLKYAAMLLKTSDLTISEIGYKVGFSSIPYFNKCFKEMYNCTPSEYRLRYA